MTTDRNARPEWVGGLLGELLARIVVGVVAGVALAGLVRAVIVVLMGG